MRRSLYVVAVLLLLVAAACGGRTDGDDDSASDTGDDDSSDTSSDQEQAVDNGGATDVGVTGDEIRIGVIADLTGVVPGLFKAAPEAVKAFAAKVNSEGGIRGRQIVVEEFDTGTNDNGNRLAYEDACDEVFASVGSESAFDTGGFEAVRDCGFPHLAGFVTDAQVQDLEFVFPRASDDYTGVGAARWYAEEFPEAVENAGYFFVNAPVSENSARRTMEARRTVGWEYIYEQPVGALESNYTPHVLEMKRQGVRAFSIVSDYNNVVRLQKALREQNYSVDIADASSQAYQRNYLEAAGPAAEGAYVAITHIPFEDAGSVPALQEYLDWLEKTSPDAEPSSNGLAAWTRAMLFAEVAEAVGPELTREKLLAELEAWGEWDADGLLPPDDISDPVPATSCFVMMQVQDGGFVRVFPDEGFHCSPDDVYKYPDS
jgi:ABC-type branched-subunit amino acid transport system substrate-binding protein